MNAMWLLVSVVLLVGGKDFVTAYDIKDLTTNTINLKMGMMLPKNDSYLKAKAGFETTAAAMVMAVDKMMADHVLSSNINISWVYTFTFFAFLNVVYDVFLL